VWVCVFVRVSVSMCFCVQVRVCCPCTFFGYIRVFVRCVCVCVCVYVEYVCLREQCIINIVLSLCYSLNTMINMIISLHVWQSFSGQNSVVFLFSLCVCVCVNLSFLLYLWMFCRLFPRLINFNSKVYLYHCNRSILGFTVTVITFNCFSLICSFR